MMAMRNSQGVIVKIKKILVVLFLAQGIASLSGCAKIYHVPIVPRTIAILPFANETTNLDGPVIVRKKLYERINHITYYRAIPLNEVDTKLHGIGITDGGQLRAVTPQQLGKALGAEVLYYGNLQVFTPTRITLGDVVRLNVKMVDPDTGNLIWEKTTGVPSMAKLDYKDSVLDNLVNLGKRAVIEKVIKIPLEKEINRLVAKMVYEMPRY